LTFCPSSTDGKGTAFSRADSPSKKTKCERPRRRANALNFPHGKPCTREIARLRSGFRQRTQTSAKRLNLREAVRPSSHDSWEADFVGGAVHHFARDARIFDCNVAVSEAGSEPALFCRSPERSRGGLTEGKESNGPLLFLLLWSEDNVLRGLKQVLEMFGHALNSAQTTSNR